MSAIDLMLIALLTLSSLGVISAKKPVYAGLSFLVALLTLSGFYLKLSAEFTAVMQILVYAGAILVIFMFVIILFQDAYQKIEQTPSLSSKGLLVLGGAVFLLSGFYAASRFVQLSFVQLSSGEGVAGSDFGTVQSLGRALFLEYFFPFEAVILIFLVAVVGAVYIARKGD